MDRYLIWQQQLAEINTVLAVFGGLALAMVAAWYLLAWTPGWMQRVLRRLYLVGGLALYLAGMAFMYVQSGGRP